MTEIRDQLYDTVKDAIMEYPGMNRAALKEICRVLDRHMYTNAGYEYLASPYTHPDANIRAARYRSVVAATAYLMLEGRVIFSPIAHSHNIELCMSAQQSGSFWKRQDMPLLLNASRLVVLTLDGWKESSGLKWEIETAKEIGIPVEMMDWDEETNAPCANYDESRNVYNGC